MTSRFILLGIDDEVTACECCGKVDLKCTMALSECDDDGNEVGIVRYGRDCGARALGWKVSADRAEKFVKGTARVSWDDCWRTIQSSTLASGSWGRLLTAPTMDVSGVTLEVWDTFYGRLPEGRNWTRISNTRMHWRVAA